MKPLVAYMHLACVILSLSFKRDNDLQHVSSGSRTRSDHVPRQSS
jgi:hypothetical protein